MSQLGDRIRDRRRELDLTQDELAAKIGPDGVSKQTVGNWEAGRSEPTKHSPDLAAALDWPEERLWNGPPPRRATSPRRGPRSPSPSRREFDALSSRVAQLERAIRETNRIRDAGLGELGAIADETDDDRDG